VLRIATTPPEIRGVLRGVKRLETGSRRLVASILNRQRTQSRTRITRAVQSATGISPQRRIRRRILLPRAGRARPDSLDAGALMLLKYTPLRWYDYRPTVGQVIDAPAPPGRAVDLMSIAGPARDRVLSGLAAEFPPEYTRRIGAVIKRTLGVPRRGRGRGRRA